MSLSHPVSRRSLGVLLVAGLVVGAFGASHLARMWLGTSAGSTVSADAGEPSYQRVIALSPSCVEIVYQFHIEDRLVGVSRFCKYPPEVSEKPVVGGYLDLNFEAVLGLRPDCVLLLKEQQQLAERLNPLGIHTVTVCHDDTRGIIDSITTIGRVFGRVGEALGITGEMEARIEAITAQGNRFSTKPRVLVCIDRDVTADHPERVIAAGKAGVHQEFVTICGGVNAYQGPIAFPTLSREKLIELDPDMIIDLVREDDWKELGEDALRAQWDAYPELRAVQTGRVTLIHDNRHLIPGPRFIETLETFARIIRPVP